MLPPTIARALFDQAGIDPTSRVGLGRLALCLLGDDGLDYDAEQAEAVRVTFEPPRILIRPELSRSRANVAIAWGLAQWWSRSHRLPFGVTVDSLALEIALPEEALLEAIEDLGAEVGALAADFVCPESFVAARLRGLASHRRPSGIRTRVGVAS